MKVTKLVHSCLLIEDGDLRTLCDPGNYSWGSGIVSDAHCTNLSSVVVTHIHPDHLDENFARKIHELSPEAVWYGPADVAEALGEWGIACNQASNDSNVQFIKSEHANLAPWFNKQPNHTSYLLYDKVLVGGDCHTLTDGLNAEYFAGAVNGGPWGAVRGFVEMVQNMNNPPRTVLPLHDWHWNDDARVGVYQHLPEALQPFGVAFIPLENGTVKKI